MRPQRSLVINAELTRLQPHLEHVEFRFRQLLQEADQRIEHVLFPQSGVVSSDGLRDLLEKGLRVAQEHAVQLAQLRQHLLERRDLDAHAVAWYLRE